MPVPMTTGTLPEGLIPGLKMWFQMTDEQIPMECMPFLDKEVSQRAWEEYASWIGFGLAGVKPEGDTFNYDAGGQGFVTRLTPFRLVNGFKVTYEMLKNGTWNPQAFRNARELRQSLDATREYIFGLILSRAFNSSYTGADGIQLCSTAHVRKWDNSTYSNRLTTDQDLSEGAVEQLLIQMRTLTNERGLITPVRPRFLFVHPQDEYKAFRLLNAVNQSATASNDPNAIRQMGVFPDGVKVNSYFTYGNGTWGIRTSIEGLVYQEREGRKFGQDMADFDTENVSFKAADWYTMGWYNPLAVFMTAGKA